MKAASKQEAPLPVEPAIPAGKVLPDKEDDRPLEASEPRNASGEQARKHSGRVILPGTTLFKSVPFLLLFSFTVMNAFFYVYLTLNDFPAIDQKSADSIIRDTFGKDYTYFSAIEEFLSEIKSTDDLSYPEFRSSLSKLNDNINRFGFHTGRLFGRSCFRFSGGGIYWASPPLEGKTAFKPRLPGETRAGRLLDVKAEMGL